MSNVVKFPNIDQIEEQACNWIARIDRSTLSERETRELRQWLREDPAHAQSLMEMAGLLDRMSVLSRVSSLFPLEEQTLSGSKSNQRSGIGSYLRIKSHLRPLAAGLTVAVILLFAFWRFEPFESSETIAPELVSTGIGERKTLMLADGSQVTVNTNSLINIAFDESRRKVILERGEAMFKVAHNSERPFLVAVGDNIVKAVGTAFNIEAMDSGIEVTVTDGVVEIATQVATQSAGGPARYSNAPGKNIPATPPHVTQVAAGQMAVIEQAVKDLKLVDTTEIEARLAWQRGELVFEGEPLEWVIAEVSRYTNQPLIIVDDRIRDIPIGGRFNIKEVKNLLDILDHGFNIEVTRSQTGQVYLSARE